MGIAQGAAHQTQGPLSAEAVLAGLDQGVIRLDRGGTVQFANPAAATLFGQEPAQMRGSHFPALVEISHRPAILRALRRTTAGYPVHGLECASAAVGDGAWVELDITPSGDGCTLLVRDVRARRAVREEVAQQHEALQETLASLLDTIPVGIVIADGAGAPRLVNRAARDLLGIHALTPLSRWFSTGVLRRPDGTPTTADDIPAARTLADGTARRDIELHIVRPWGEAIPVLLNTDAVHDRDGRLVEVCCTLTDIRERRHIERQLQQAQKMDAIGTLAGGIAHDFNNILCAITGYSELALLQTDLSTRGRGLIGEIHRSCERAAKLTRQLLAFSRMDALAPRPMRMNTVVRDMEPMLQRLIGTDVRMAIELEDDVERIQADPGQIEQVLLNLVINARDAMPEGGPLLVRTEQIELPDDAAKHDVCAPAGRYAVLTVGDEGSGMDARTLAHAFEPFFTTKARGKGTGLGLSTVYGIVKQSRGAVDIHSLVGTGTTFRIYLPCVDAPASVEADARPQAPAADPHGPATVLLVEDELLVRSLIREILEDDGYHVVEAGNGREALERVQLTADPIHLLVTDIVMPELGGLELAEGLRRVQEDLKVLFVSGHADEALSGSGVLAGRTAFLPKPFDAATLSRRVRELLSHVPAS